MNARFLIGIVLAALIGMGCRVFGIPSPAPPLLIGALLVVAMTSGYQLTDRWLVRRKSVRATDPETRT
jgi:XapX domain-containing protein